MEKRSALMLIVLLSLVTLLLFSSAVSVFANPAVEDTRKSIMRIHVADTRGNFLGGGSGFIIGDGEPVQFVVTNWHVVDPQNYNRREVRVSLWFSAGDLVPVMVYHSIPDANIAILMIDQNHLLYGYEPLSLAPMNMVNVGEEVVYALGFQGVNLPDFYRSYSTDVIATKGIVSQVAVWRGVAHYQTDILIDKGSTGGPMINESGHVIGINNWKAYEADRIRGAVQIDYLIDALSRRNIPFKIAGERYISDDIDEDEDDEDEDDEYLLLYIGIGAAALLLIVVILLFGGKSKKQVTAPPAPVRPAGPPVGSMPSPPMQGKTQAAPRDMAQSAPPGKTQAAPREMPQKKAEVSATEAKKTTPRANIIGVSGHFSGQTFDMVGDQLIIGRDPKVAQIVFPQSNESISRKHCAIRFDQSSSKFIIEDFSTNGTFIATNQKMEKNKQYYLNAGDRFYVAEPAESFEVKIV